MERDDGNTVRGSEGIKISWRHSSRFKLLLFSALLVLYGLLFSVLFANNTIRFSQSSRQITSARTEYYDGYSYLGQVHLALKNYYNYPSEDYYQIYLESREAFLSFVDKLRSLNYGPYSYDLGLLCEAYLSEADRAIGGEVETLDEVEHIYALLGSFSSYSMKEMEEQLNLYMDQENTGMRERLRRYIALMTVVSGFIVVAVFLFVNSYLKPLETLADMAAKTSTDNWVIQDSPVKRKDEPGLLYEKFYGMMNQIRLQFDELVEKQHLEIELQEEKERAAQAQAQVASTRLRVFQSQINSHFLFNTMNMISNMAYMEQAPSVQNAANLLAQFLRSTLSQFNRVVTLEEEFQTVRYYVEIQKLRFQDRLIFEDSLDPDVEDCQIPAVTLQPLIENGIIHGVSMKRNGFIRYAASIEGDSVILSVYDDGAGMSKEEVSALCQRMGDRSESASTEGHGIGLYNVYERLRLMYPGKVRFSAESEQGEFTRIGFRIRLKDPTEEPGTEEG